MIVVSPLLSLIEDQLKILKARGIACGAVEGGGDALFASAMRGELRLIYITPEKLANWRGQLGRLVREKLICGVAIDEAHCISTWGHDFRPSYAALSSLHEDLPGIPIMALTATASPRVQEVCGFPVFFFSFSFSLFQPSDCRFQLLLLLLLLSLFAETEPGYCWNAEDEQFLPRQVIL